MILRIEKNIQKQKHIKQTISHFEEYPKHSYESFTYNEQFHYKPCVKVINKNKIERFLGSGSVKSKGIIIVRDDAKQTKELKTKNIVKQLVITKVKVRS